MRTRCAMLEGNSSLTWRSRLLLLCLLAVALSVAKASETSEPLTAIWVTQQLTVVHRDEYIDYSCPALVDRVTSILRALGAHVAPGTEVSCHANGWSRTVSMTLQRPVEATPENVRLAVASDSTERLLAHVQHRTLPGETDLERFPAAWRTVSLTRIRALRIESADCGLLHTLRTKVFPRLDVRVVNHEFQCGHGASSVRPKVITEVLLPLAGGVTS